MDYFTHDGYLSEKLYREFERIDKFFEFFRDEFVASIQEIVFEYYPQYATSETLNDDLFLYANEIINTAESVIYKDSSYPACRLQEELEAMTRIVQKEPGTGQNHEFIKRVHFKAKELMVNHFPLINDLSGNGFRLLEKYTAMYNWEFVTAFYASIK